MLKLSHLKILKIMDIVKGKIGNALTSAASNHVVATANDIYDESIGKYQNEINGGLYSMPIATALGISTKYDADSNLVLNIPFSQAGQSKTHEVVIPLVTSTEPGLMSANEHNDIKALVGKGAVNKNITFETDVNNPDNVELSYYSYDGNNMWVNKRIRVPLAERGHAGLIPWVEINKLKELIYQPLLIGSISFDASNDEVTLHYNNRGDAAGPATATIPLATSTSSGVISADLYKYLYSVQNGAILINPIKISQADNGLTLKYSSKHNDNIYRTNVNIPLASNTTNGVISKEDYTALRTLIDNSSSTDSPYGEYPLMLGQPITFENVNGSLNMKWMAISPGGEPYNSTAIIPIVNNNCSGLMSSSSYLHLNNLLDAHLVKDVNVISTYKANESDDTTQTAIEVTKYSSTTPTKITIPLPSATSTSSGAMTPNQVAFIDYHQGHNTYDDFTDIPVDKHVCVVNLNYTTAEGETFKALTVVMDGIGKYDGAEVLLYCNHNGSANLGIGVPANSTNGAEYVLITNDGQQYILVGTQELDFVLSCTYINNKWYVKKL